MKKLFVSVLIALISLSVLAQPTTVNLTNRIETGLNTNTVVLTNTATVATNTPVASLAAPVPGSIETYYVYAAMTLVAILVPMLVAVIKVWFPKLEKSYSHVFPVIATIVGVLLVWAINQLTTLHMAGILGIFLGAAGVGLREVYDQTKSLWPAPPVIALPTLTLSGPSVVSYWSGPGPESGQAPQAILVPGGPTPVAPSNASSLSITTVQPQAVPEVKGTSK